MPSARTSVGNKEYEYKGKKERAAKPQQAGDRRGTGRFGDAAVAVALRHAIDPTASFSACQTFFHDNFSDAVRGRIRDVWTASRPYVFSRPDVAVEGWCGRMGCSRSGTCGMKAFPGKQPFFAFHANEGGGFPPTRIDGCCDAKGRVLAFLPSFTVIPAPCGCSRGICCRVAAKAPAGATLQAFMKTFTLSALAPRGCGRKRGGAGG